MSDTPYTPKNSPYSSMTSPYGAKVSPYSGYNLDPTISEPSLLIGNGFYLLIDDQNKLLINGV